MKSSEKEIRTEVIVIPIAVTIFVSIVVTWYIASYGVEVVTLVVFEAVGWQKRQGCLIH